MQLSNKKITETIFPTDRIESTDVTILLLKNPFTNTKMKPFLVSFFSSLSYYDFFVVIKLFVHHLTRQIQSKQRLNIELQSLCGRHKQLNVRQRCPFRFLEIYIYSNRPLNLIRCTALSLYRYESK